MRRHLSRALRPRTLLLELLYTINRKVDLIMTELAQLTVDAAALQQAFTQLQSDLTTGLTDLRSQVVNLQTDLGHAPAIDAIDRQIAGLIDQVQSADQNIKAADPGPQPTQAAPPSAPLPPETAIPAPGETPEAPAAPPADVPATDGTSGAAPATSGQGDPATSTDPNASESSDGGTTDGALSQPAADEPATPPAA